MQRDLKAIVDGGIGGCLGTATMSLLMLAGEEAGLMGGHPPKQIITKALDAMGMGGQSDGTENALAVLMHFGFGVAAGSVFAVLHRRLPLRIPPAVHGIVFGGLVWGASYKGWIPALGIMPDPERDKLSRPEVMLVAHLIYGCTLGM
nr:DUF1440 domain-containing protein [Armatimonadota bacterium]